MRGWPEFPRSRAPGFQGSVPRVQTLELARAPLPGRTDGVCKCSLAQPKFRADKRAEPLEDREGPGRVMLSGRENLLPSPRPGPWLLFLAGNH